MLEVRLLGQFDVRLNGQPVEIPSRPAQSLLAYLILRPGTRHRREKLAGMFWPDSGEVNARNNLRLALWRIHKALGDGYLQADRISVAFNANACDWRDVAVIAQDTDQTCSADDLLGSVAAYAGELLPGFYDEWVAPERERLRAIFEWKMRLLLDRLVAEQRWQEAINSAERWIALGETPESAYRALMIAHSRLGGLASVAAIYGRCVAALERELGVEPSDETTRLYAQIRARAAGERANWGDHDGASDTPADSRSRSSAPRLSQPPTPFIGRKQELHEIGALLDDPACRLLTLIGPGGTGKTRLALAAATQRADAYRHGAHVVNLAPLASADLLVPAIAQTLNLPLGNADDPGDALLNYLREKTLLLLLDNFEHLRAGVDLISDMLAAAPGLTILVTSRERLHLRAEWVYDIGGMAFPEHAAQPDFDTFDAVQLFLSHARRAQPRYRLDEADKAAVIDICRFVGGMPLGIELAAAWVRALPLSEIARELARNLNLLTTSMRDIPERHRSMRAVIEHSWRLLTQAEREAFTRLAVFRGGFTREAAQAIAGAGLDTLLGLIDKSLLHTDAIGRYGLHELLRQFAEEHLRADAEACRDAHDHHSAFFLQLLERSEAGLKSARQPIVTAAIERDWDNVRAAWAWAIRRGHWNCLRQSMIALHIIMEMRARQQEGVALFKALADAPDDAQNDAAPSEAMLAVTAFARTLQSWYLGRLGQSEAAKAGLEHSRAAIHRYGNPYEIAVHDHLYSFSCVADPVAASALFDRSLSMLREQGATWEVAFSVTGIGLGAYERGQNVEARRLFEQGLADWRTTGEPTGIATGLHHLGCVAASLGEYEEARRLQYECLAVRQASNHQLGGAFCFERLGDIACAETQFAEAERFYRQSLEIYSDLALDGHRAWILSRLGEALREQNKLDEAATILAEGLAIAEQGGDLRGISRAHNQLGYLAFKQGLIDPARDHWRIALDTARRVPERYQLLVMLDTLMGLAAFTVRTGNHERAAELLALIQQTAAMDRPSQAKAETLLADLRSCLPADVFEAACECGRTLELETVIVDMLREL